MEAAVVVSAGPAVTNTLTAVHVARENGWPVVVLAGRRALYQEGIGYFQELDGTSILAPFTKFAGTVRRTSDIAGTIRQAFAAAETGPRGPVFIDLPEDVLEGFCEVDQISPPPKPSRPAFESDVIERVAQVIANASRPLLILGEEIRWSLCPRSLKILVEDIGIPFITSPMGRGLLPDDHPMSANSIRRWCQRRADVVILAGAWFDWRFRFATELSPDAAVIHATADATTLGKNVGRSLNALGEPGEFLRRLAGALSVVVKAGHDQQRYSHWQDLLSKSRANNAELLSAWLSHTSDRILPQHLYCALRDLLPEDSIIALEGNICLAAAQKILQARRPASWLDPGRNGFIGGSIAFAMGAKLAQPNRSVIALCGDTGFGMSAMELEAAVRHRIPIIVVIANNDGNGGAVRQNMFLPSEYPERFSQFLPQLRYERIMELFGGHAENVTAIGQLAPALARAVASGLPSCLNVGIDPQARHSGFW
jgi:2-hydroxyacyl-CoA lyase 1